nr:hypothetical protein [Streptomyces sp. 846.5]
MAKPTEEQRQQRAAKRAIRAALAAEAEEQRDGERIELWKREGTHLSWEEYRAGEPCRGCGEPMSDGLGNWWPTLKLSEPERREYEEAQQAFRERHSNCKGGRWSIDGSRVTHCGICCPPPPMSPKQIEKLYKLLSSMTPPEERKKELDAWNLTLRCDHVVPFIQHRSNTYVSTSVVDCPECEARRGVVSREHVGPAYNDDGTSRQRDSAQQEQLARELAAITAKLARQQRTAAATQRRIDEIQEQLQDRP